MRLLKNFIAEPECAAVLTTNDSVQGGSVVLYSLAVCGPVTNGRSVLLAPAFGEAGWQLDAAKLGSTLGSAVVFLNDFHAVGLGLPVEPPHPPLSNQ